jgi:hypothetical protein
MKMVGGAYPSAMMRFSDVMMPRMSGLEMHGQLRWVSLREFPFLKIETRLVFRSGSFDC